MPVVLCREPLPEEAVLRVQTEVVQEPLVRQPASLVVPVVGEAEPILVALVVLAVPVVRLEEAEVVEVVVRQQAEHEQMVE